MAVLIFLAAATWARIVAARFVPYVGPTRLGGGFAHRLRATTISTIPAVSTRGNGRSCCTARSTAHWTESSTHVAGYWLVRLRGKFDAKNLLHDEMLNLGLQFLPHGEGFALVFYQRVTLTNGDEANTLA